MGGNRYILISLVLFLLVLCGESYQNSKKSSVKKSNFPIRTKRINEQSDEPVFLNESETKLDNRINQIIKAGKYVIEFLRTDGKFKPPSAGISWFAIYIIFVLLSPMAIPLLWSPLVLVIGYFVFLAYELDFPQEHVVEARHFMLS